MKRPRVNVKREPRGTLRLSHDTLFVIGALPLVDFGLTVSCITLVIAYKKNLGRRTLHGEECEDTSDVGRSKISWLGHRTLRRPLRLPYLPEIYEAYRIQPVFFFSVSCTTSYSYSRCSCITDY